MENPTNSFSDASARIKSKTMMSWKYIYSESLFNTIYICILY